jgi:hypothetical protein
MNDMNNNIQKESKKARINAFISRKNYQGIDNLMDNEELISMRLSKGAILDLALTNLFHSLSIGESLEAIAIQHLEAIAEIKEGDA